MTNIDHPFDSHAARARSKADRERARADWRDLVALAADAEQQRDDARRWAVRLEGEYAALVAVVDLARTTAVEAIAAREAALLQLDAANDRAARLRAQRDEDVAALADVLAACDAVAVAALTDVLAACDVVAGGAQLEQSTLTRVLSAATVASRMAGVRQFVERYRRPQPACSNCGMRHAPGDTERCIEGHGAP